MSTAAAVSTTAQLQSQARRLRSQATSLDPLVAEAYHRRAAELDLRAWLEAVWNPSLLDLRDALPTDGPGRTVAREGRLKVTAA